MRKNFKIVTEIVIKSGKFYIPYYQTKTKSNHPKSIEIDGSILHDSKLIAQHFADYFTNIAEKIVKTKFLGNG